MEKHYTTKHDILKFFTDKEVNFTDSTPVSDRYIDFNSIKSEFTKCTKDELLSYLDTLCVDNYLYSTFQGKNPSFILIVPGRRIFYERRFIIDGEKEDLELKTKRFIYKARYVPYILSLAAITVSAFAYFKKPDKGYIEKKEAQQQKKQETTQNTGIQPDTSEKKVTLKKSVK